MKIVWLVILLATVNCALAQRFQRTVNTVAELIAENPNNAMTNVWVAGYSAPNDGGEGVFTWRRGSAAVADGGTILGSTHALAPVGRYHRQFSGDINVRWFGAMGDGSNISIPVKAAYDAIDKALGGGLFFPHGTHSFNLVVSNKNITLRFETSTKDDSGSPIVNTISAADVTQPIITLGDGVNFAKGSRILGGYFKGNGTGVGLRLAGGAYECTFHDAQFYNFATNIWAQASGLTLPCAVNRFYNSSILAANVDNSRGLYVAAPDAGVGFTTATYFIGCHFNSQIGGVNTHIIELDGSAVDMSSTYFDFLTNSPILFSMSAGVNVQPPILHCSNVSLDGSSTFPIVQENFGASKRISALVQGWYTFNGQIKWADGTISEQALAQSGLENGGNLFGSIMRGPITFLTASGELTNKTWMRIENDADAQLLMANTNGPIRLESNTNSLFSVQGTNKVVVSGIGSEIYGRLLVTSDGATEFSDMPATNGIRVVTFIATNSVVDALHIDAYSHAFTNGEIAAISMGLKNSTNGDSTSRILHLGNVNHNRETRMGFQTHSLSSNSWNTGLWLNEFGAVSMGLTQAHTSAALDITSTTGGLLIPRMSEAQRLAIINPTDGLMVFQNTGVQNYYIYQTGWQILGSGAAGTPGGADTQFQFNSAGAFGGAASAAYSAATGLTTIDRLKVPYWTERNITNVTGNATFDLSGAPILRTTNAANQTITLANVPGSGHVAWLLRLSGNGTSTFTLVAPGGYTLTPRWGAFASTPYNGLTEYYFEREGTTIYYDTVAPFSLADFPTAVQGDILYRGATAWARLAAGASGLFLKTQGAGANPMWDSAGAGSGNGNMFNTGANALNVVPRAIDTSSTNYVPSLLLVDTNGSMTIGDDTLATLTNIYRVTGADLQELRNAGGINLLTAGFTGGSLSAAGAASGSATVGSTGYFIVSGKSRQGSSTNSYAEFTDNAGTNFTGLRWGPTTNSIMWLKTNNTFMATVGNDEFTMVDILAPADAYAAGWDGSFEVPNKNDIYDKIQTLSGGTVGTMINTGTPAVGAVPRHLDITGTNTEPSVVIIDASGNVTGINSATVATLNVGTLNLTNKLDRSLITNGTPSKLVYNDPATGLLSELHVGSGLSISGTNLLSSPTDTDLIAIAALTGTGLLARTGAGTYSERTITAGSNMSIVNGNGVAGNPTLSVLDSPTFYNLTVTTNLTLSGNSAASAPIGTMTGLWFTGGTTTTTKPHFLIEGTGATSTGWLTTGTAFGINAASGFAGDFIHADLNGSTRFYVTSAGNLQAEGTVISGGSMSSGSNMTVASGGSINWLSRTAMASSAAGFVEMYNAAATGFTKLTLGVSDAAPDANVTIQAGSGVGADIGGGGITVASGTTTGNSIVRGNPKVAFSKFSTASSSTANALATSLSLGGTLKVDTTTTGNFGAGEDDLISYTIPAAQLSLDGDYFEFDVFGTFAANANSAQVKLYWDGLAFFDSTSLIFNGVTWKATGKIIRTSATTVKIQGDFGISGTLLGALTTTTRYYSTDTSTLTGTIVFKVTGTDTGGVPADNKVVQEGMVLRQFLGQ